MCFVVTPHVSLMFDDYLRCFHMFPVFFDGVVIPHFYHIMFCYPPFFQYVWWLYTVFTILLMLIYIFPYVSWLCHMFPIFLGYTTLSGIFDHNPSHMFELFPYFWWFYAVPPYIFDGYTHMFDGYTTWLCPMVGSHPKVRQVLRRQPGAKLGGKSRLLMGKKTHRNTWKKSGKHMEN